MKKNVLLILLGCVLIGCQNEIKCIEGVYSYKISGKAIVTDGASTNTIVLKDEMGAMEIIGQKSNNVLLTFNQLGGGVFTTTGVLKDSVLSLEPFDRVITDAKAYDVVVSGSGRVYGKTIVFDLQYMGEELNADAVTMIAKHN